MPWQDNGTYNLKGLTWCDGVFDPISAVLNSHEVTRRFLYWKYFEGFRLWHFAIQGLFRGSYFFIGNIYPSNCEGRVSGTHPLYERCKQELQRRAREEQHKLNKKIVLITVIGTITATIIGALISTATSYYLKPKPISVTKHVCLHKISKVGNVKTFMKKRDKGEGENKER